MYNRRLERLYDLSRMVQADPNLGERKIKLLKKFALRLGFTPGNADYIVDKALKLVELGVDLDEFTFEIKNMNK